MMIGTNKPYWMFVLVAIACGWGVIKIANAQQCPFGCLESVKTACDLDAYYEFAGVGVAYELNDPAAAGIAGGTLAYKSYSYDAYYECGCSWQFCQIPCVTANYPYPEDSAAGYFYIECELE